MSSDFFQKGNKDYSEKVLGTFDKPSVVEAFSPYTDLRFNYFMPTHDIKRRLETSKKEAIQKRRKIDIKFNRFYDNHCSYFKFESVSNMRSILVNNESVKSFQPSEFLEHITSTNQGKIYYLIGEVGVGKSTYLSSLIREFEKKSYKDNQHGLFLNIIKFSDLKELHSDEEDLDKKIIKLLLKYLNPYFKHKDRIPNYSNLEDFINHCMSNFANHKLVLAFDDLDGIYDEYGKELFYYQGVEDQFKKWRKENIKSNILVDVIRKLIEVMNKFSGKNIDFILSLRPNTYNISTHTGLGVGNQANECIFIKINKESLLEDNGVINNRISILDSNIITNINAVKKNFRSFIGVSMDHKLHGLRHLIDNSSAIFSKDMNKEYNEWMFEMFTYLDNHDTYTQSRWGGIVNIFLVNSNYRKDEDHPSTLGDLRYPDYLKQSHSQTYWLKYLISRVFLDEQMSSQSMYDRYFTKYQRHIYQLCLYSLTEVQHGRLISCIKDVQTGNPSLKKTERLEYCAGESCGNLFFKFTYIAAIVDDTYLQIPNILEEDTTFTDPWLYTSFLPNNKDEIEEWIKWLESSIYKVFLFMKILKISWENYEIKKIPRLEKYKPNFEKIQEKHIQEIKIIATSLNYQDIDDTIKKTLEKQKKRDEELIEFFSNLPIE